MAAPGFLLPWGILGVGVYYGKIQNAHPYSIFAWATLPRNGTFISNDGFAVCNRPGETHRNTDRNEKSGSGSQILASWLVDLETDSRSCHFQPLNISSNASFTAASVDFSMRRKISFSIMDCSRFSFRFWSCFFRWLFLKAL